MQPIASDDVAILAEITVGKPTGTTIDVGGPEPIRMDDLVRKYLEATPRPLLLASP